MVKPSTNSIALKNRLAHMILLLAFATQASAWDWWPLPMAAPDTCRDSLFYVGEIYAHASSGAQTPSLLWRNTHGNISLQPYAGTISAGVIKPATRPNRWFDYDFGIVLNGRFGGGQPGSGQTDITGYCSELYAHARLYIVDITAGIHPISFCPGDKELSVGGLLFSDNAHPIPRISVGFERWTPIPGLFGYAEVKGGMSHGWLTDNAEGIKGTMLHHKYIGGRIGGKLPVNISYEFHHAAQWGGYSTKQGDLGNDWNSFKHIFLAKQGGSTKSDQLNAQGNHILSQTLCLTAKGDRWHLDIYWQDIQEDGRPRFLGKGQNSEDGLWGISAVQQHWPFIQGVTMEFFNTTDQSGPWHDRDGFVFGGADGYYQNSSYPQGWTYYGRIIGLPVCTPNNSRVMGGNVGVKGDIYGFRYRFQCTHAYNLGTYSQRAESANTAVLLEVKKIVPQAWNMEFGLSLAGDFGTQYGNTFGAMITIRKQGLITSW